MIRAAMAVAAVGTGRFGRAEQARRARFARLVALIVDTIFVGILSSIATTVYGVTQFTGTSVPGGGFAYGTSQVEIPALWTGAIWLVYYAACEGMFSATPGKILNGLLVVSDDGRPLGLHSVAIRNLLRLVDALPAMYAIGGVAVLVTPYSQRIGDLAAHTTVVFRQDATEPDTARNSGRRARLVLMAMLAMALVFTAGFAYFQRPVLVVEGNFNQHQLVRNDLVTYSLGTPSRTLGTVTYPITAQTATESCSGTIVLQWAGLLGWTMTEGQLNCFPS